MRLTFIILLISTLCAGCKKNALVGESEFVNNVAVVKISPEYSSMEFVDISPILDSVKYVKLELTDESIIGYIQKIVVYEEQIYILDTQTMSLFVFDMNGKYLFKIAQIGHGPEEYVQLDFFDVDPQNGNIVLTDLMSYSLMRFDQDGKFISRSKIPLWGEGIAPFDNNSAILIANYRNNKHMLEQEFNLLHLDSSMQIEKAYFPYNSSNFEKIKIPSPQSGFFYYYNGSLHFFPALGNNIYQVTEEGLAQKYSIDFGDHTFDTSYLDRGEYLEEYQKRGEYYQLGSVAETDEYLTFSFSKFAFPAIFTTFYSKKDGKTLNGLMYTIGEDFFYGLPLRTTYNSWFVGEIESEKLMNWKEENKDVPENSFLKEKMDFAKTVTIEDNPALIFFKFKPSI